MIYKNMIRHGLLGLACLLTSGIFAQIETRRVSFPSGKSSTSIKSSLKGGKTIDYVVRAQEGQTLSVSLTTSNASNYFNILPPGSNDEAYFVGSSDGNSYSGSVSASGDWKIRVYLIRAAARRNETANFTLKVSVAGSMSASKDAKVSGTNYNATGPVNAYMGGSTKPVEAKFGVIRHGSGNAEIHLTVPNSLTHKIRFADNKWSCLEGCSSINAQRINPDEWRVTVDDYTSYIISNAIVYGG